MAKEARGERWGSIGDAEEEGARKIVEGDGREDVVEVVG